ncbi:MAG: HAD-IA family hydrolase [Eubacterium sp.]|nr:HAD-IA family hydrolase [Eubacterium sp.]
MSFTNKKCAVFDLDGTLIDTITDLRNACEAVMNNHGFKAEYTDDDYKRFVGNGIRKLVDRAFRESLDAETLDLYLSEFLEYYSAHSLDNTRPYSGISEQLKLLKERGIKMCVITNKAEPAAVNIIEKLFGEGVFDLIVGQRDGLPTKPAPDGVRLALKELGFTPDEALYFGDSNVDMQTAINAGVDAVGVLWGFRSYGELSQYKPACLINNPDEISGLFK